MICRVLGIDPGLACTGWGLIDSDGIRHKHLDHGVIETDSGSPPEQRLLILHRELTALLRAFKPVAMGIERLFFIKNISSAMPVSQARGIALLVAAQNNVKVEEFSPTSIKESVVGVGRADKKQVQDMVRLLLGLDELPKSDHAADALAAAITLIHHGNLWSTVLTAF